MTLRLIAPLLVLVGGCANSPTPNYDARFGDAVRHARHMMTLNPQAATLPAPGGMDGKAAQEALERYQDSFRKPPPVVNVINIGGQTGSGRNR